MPDQRLDNGELIERLVVPLNQLYDRLMEWSKKDNSMIAGKVYYWAAGMHALCKGGKVSTSESSNSAAFTMAFEGSKSSREHNQVIAHP